MTPLLLLLIILCAAGLIPHTSSVKNVTIAKCCKLDEHLTNENKCAFSDHNTWTIKVFSPAKRTFLPKGTIPANWHLKADMKPNCARPALLTANLGNYVPFQNGSLFVVEYNQLVHPQRYCIDYSTALVCLEDDNKPQSIAYVRIKKCCGPDAIFSDTNQTCIAVRDASYQIDVGADKTLTAGFPACSQHRIAFLGKLHEAKIQANGSLLLQESRVLLPVGNYCLEHVLENAGKNND